MTWIYISLSFLLLNLVTALFLFVVAPRLRRKLTVQGGGKISVGISEYPDSLLLEYAMRRTDESMNRFSVSRVAWNKVDDALMGREIDAAYINTGEARRILRKAPDRFVLGSAPLASYFGFALLTRSTSRFRTFSDIYHEFWNRDFPTVEVPKTVDMDVGRNAARAFCLQFAGEEKYVVAAPDTDHMRSLFQLANEMSVPIAVHPNAPSDPDDALDFFMRGNGVAFVGGATQRLRGKHLGLACLFSHSEFPELMEPETNSLIVSRDRLNGSAPRLLAGLQTLWASNLALLNGSETARTTFLSFVRSSLKPAPQSSGDVPSGETLEDGELYVLFQEWFRISGLRWPDPGASDSEPQARQRRFSVVGRQS